MPSLTTPDFKTQPPSGIVTKRWCRGLYSATVRPTSSELTQPLVQSSMSGGHGGGGGIGSGDGGGGDGDSIAVQQ